MDTTDHKSLRYSLASSSAASNLPSDIPRDAITDSLKLIHELKTQQVELEMQSEELRRAERKLQQTCRSFTDFYDFAPVGYFTLTTRGLIHTSNLTGADFLKRDRIRIIGTDFIDYVHPDDRAIFAAHLQALSEKAGPEECEVQLLQRQDQVFYAHLKSTLVFDEDSGGAMIRSVVSDITQRRLLQHELEIARRKADLAQQAKSQFLANMSHEIRTPLGVILGFSEVLLEEADEDRALSEPILAIRRNGEHLLNIINEILDLAKVEAGDLTTENMLVSIDGSVREVMNLLKAKAISKNLRISLRKSDDFPDLINTDPTRLRQILLNLLGNAIKFTERGGVEIRLGTSTGEQEPRLTIDVRDTGCGMTEACRAALFQPFSQGDFSTTRKYGGTGLGLALSQKLAEAIGGSLGLVASELGKGSTFRLTLNSGRTAGESLAKSEEGEIDPGVRTLELVTLNRIKILVISENITQSRELVSLLEGNGALVHSVEDGFEGVSKALTHCFDLLLLDTVTPGLCPSEVIKLLRANHFDRPILAILHQAAALSRMDAFEAGFNGQIARPYHAAEIIREILRQVKRHH